jgi:hypothetical protein
VTDLSHKAGDVRPPDNTENSNAPSERARNHDFLTCEEARDYLWAEYRLQRSERRLGQLRLSGEGPAYHRAGNAVRYRRSALDDWALKLLGAPAISTADETARRQVA